MSPSRPSTVPTLADLVEAVHAGAADAPAPLVVTVDRDHDADTVAFGTWPVPPSVDHPADSLVGFVAPAAWDAVGLITNGWAHDLADTAHAAATGGLADSGDLVASRGGSHHPQRRPAPIGSHVPVTGSACVRATVVLDRNDSAVSIIDRPDRDPQVLCHRPGGWAADVLARTLGLPTPAPVDPLAAWVEAAWLDRIAAMVLARPGQIRSWRPLALLHPLAPAGRPLPGALLAVETQALDLESSWTRMRQLWSAGTSAQQAAAHPPGGTVRALPHWFDDGSFSRWVQRDLPPADLVLPAVLDAVPADSRAELIDALVSVTPPVGAP
ncbi:hypothetical protein BH23ACT2_BH23ACT2_13900 [soil metagenome]